MSSRVLLLAGALFSLAVITASGCNGVNSPKEKNPAPPLSPTEKTVAAAGNSFSTNLFNRVAAAEQGKNFFISPLSVSMALAMTLNGASGQTYTEMQQTLGLSGLSNAEINQSYQHMISMFADLDPNVKFNIANSIWYRNTFTVLDSFVSTDSRYFNAKVSALDFGSPNAAGEINSWVSSNTNGKITGVVSPPLPQSAMMYLINALYFHGTWKYKFEYEMTKLDTFYLAEGQTEMDSMMTMNDTLDYYSDESFSAISLPYGNGDYSMVILLPSASQGNTGGVPALSQAELNSVFAGLRPAAVNVTIPKFKLNFSASLNDELAGMGMADAFTSAADFSRINPAGGLYISDVLHKTYIEVNEAGTEAAAVTVVKMYATAIGTGPRTFIANRPFIFVIKENRDNTIMFMGALTKPSAG